MNSRAVTAASRALLASRSSSINLARNSSHYKPPANWYEPTYNELPVPQGAWKGAYDANQRKYNMHLALGVGFFIITIGVVTKSGIIDFNASPPPLPENF